MKSTFWNYYKEQKGEMIKEQDEIDDYFKDEHEFDDDASEDENKTE